MEKSIVGLAFFLSLMFSPGIAAAFQAADLQTKDGIAGISLETTQDKVRVLIDGQLFTVFHASSGSMSKPFLHPVFGPGQVPMTRDWPISEDRIGESRDHPHHKSLWFSHEISGVDFWAEKGGVVKTLQVEPTNAGNGFLAKSQWLSRADGSTVLMDETVYTFGLTDRSRWMQCQIRFKATHGDFQFDDTKEGLFAIRTHPDLRLKADPKAGVAEVFGTATNSEGDSGGSIWGKAARWVLYQGEVDDQSVAVAIYDHPDNLRHPTTWHARDYGLIAANPFGLHHFLGKPKGTGAYVVKDGESLELQYRIEFFSGSVDASTVQQHFKRFADKTDQKENP